MAKKVVATLKNKAATKNVSKVIKLVKSEKTGAYTFQEDIIPSELVKEYMERK